MDSRLRLYDEITDDHSNWDKYPIIGMAGDAAAQKAAHGHKSHVHAHQEDGQSYVHIHPVSYTHLDVYKRQLYDGALPEDTLLPLCAKYGLLL